MDLIDVSLDEPDEIPIRRARGKRSSILKPSKVLTELFEGDEITIGRRSQGSKRVSFAETFQVKELLTGNIYDIPTLKDVPVLKENVPAKPISKNLDIFQTAESCSSFEKNPFLDEPILPIHSALVNISNAAETLIRKETSGDSLIQSMQSQTDNAFNDHSKRVGDMKLTFIKSHQSSNQLNMPNLDDICSASNSKEAISKLATKPYGLDFSTSKLFTDDKENVLHYPKQSEVIAESTRLESPSNILELTCAETMIGDPDSKSSDLTRHSELLFDFKQINESQDISLNMVNSDKENVYHPQPCHKRPRGHSYAKDPNLTKALVSEMDFTCLADDEGSLSESLTEESKFLNQSMFIANDKLKVSDFSDSSMMKDDVPHHESVPPHYQTEPNVHARKDISFNKSQYHLEDMDMTCIINESCLDQNGFKTLELTQAPPDLFATRISEIHETLKVTQVIDIFQEIETDEGIPDSDLCTYNSHEGSWYQDKQVLQREVVMLDKVQQEMVGNNLVESNKPKGKFEAPIIYERSCVSMNEDLDNDPNAVETLKLLAQSKNCLDETKKQIEEMDITCITNSLEEPFSFAMPQNVSREIAEQTMEKEMEITCSNMEESSLQDMNEDLSIDHECLSVSFPQISLKEFEKNNTRRNMARTCMNDSIKEEADCPKPPPMLPDATLISGRSVVPSIIDESSLCVLPNAVMNENTSLVNISMQSNASNLVMTGEFSESLRSEARSFLKKKLKCTPKDEAISGIFPKDMLYKFRDSRNPILHFPSINFKKLQMKLTRGPGVSGLNYKLKRSLLNSNIALTEVQVSPFLNSRRKSRGFYTSDPETSLVEHRAPRVYEVDKILPEKNLLAQPVLYEEKENKYESHEKTKIAVNYSIDTSIKFEEKDKQPEKLLTDNTEEHEVVMKEHDEADQPMKVHVDNKFFGLEITKDIECLQNNPVVWDISLDGELEGESIAQSHENVQPMNPTVLSNGLIQFEAQNSFVRNIHGKDTSEENPSNVLKHNMLKIDSLKKIVSSPDVHSSELAILVTSPEPVPPVFNDSVEASRSCNSFTDMPDMLTCNFNAIVSQLSGHANTECFNVMELQPCEQSQQSAYVSLEQVADLDSKIVQISEIESPIPRRKRPELASSPSFIVLKSPIPRTPSPVPRKRIRKSPVSEISHSTELSKADIQDNNFEKEYAVEHNASDVSHVPCVLQSKLLPIPSQISEHSIPNRVETSSLPFVKSASTHETPLSFRKSLFSLNRGMPQDDMASLSANGKQSSLIPDTSPLQGTTINCFDEQRPAHIVAKGPTTSAGSSMECEKSENGQFHINESDGKVEKQSILPELNFSSANHIESNKVVPDMDGVEVIGQTVDPLCTNAIENLEKRCPAVCNAPDESVKVQLVNMMKEAVSHRWNPVKYSSKNAVLELTFGRIEHRCYMFVKIDFEHVDGWEISFEVNPKYAQDFHVKFYQRTLGYKIFRHRIKPICIPAPSSGDALIEELKRIAATAKNIGMLTHDLVGVQSLVAHHTVSESIEPLVVQVECFNDKRSSKFEATFEVDVDNYPAENNVPKIKHLDYMDATEELLQLAQTLEAKVNPLYEMIKLLFHN